MIKRRKFDDTKCCRCFVDHAWSRIAADKVEGESTACFPDSAYADTMIRVKP
jgi:hypothetical protein